MICDPPKHEILVSKGLLVFGPRSVRHYLLSRNYYFKRKFKPRDAYISVFENHSFSAVSLRRNAFEAGKAFLRSSKLISLNLLINVRICLR